MLFFSYIFMWEEGHGLPAENKKLYTLADVAITVDGIIALIVCDCINNDYPIKAKKPVDC